VHGDRSRPSRRLPRISVIIPAHNEEQSIRHVLADLPLRKLCEVIVVDNASTDRTAEAARDFAPNVRVVHEPRPGYGSACLKGIASLDPATEIVVFIDGDYSDHGNELPRVVAPILRGRAEFVVGSRARGQAERGSLTPVQVFGNWLATTLMRLIWRGRWTDLGPFRAITHDALKRLRMRDTNYGWTVEMQIKALQHRLHVAEVPVSYRRRIGTSKISGSISGSAKAGYKILYTIARYWLNP
jgi:glycosyltransferase involved in cell wall biosynthesis